MRPHQWEPRPQREPRDWRLLALMVAVMLAPIALDLLGI